jgi:hypothetical protein
MPSPTVCASPTEFWVTCPRCRVPRKFVCLDGQTLSRCGGCEWYFTFGTQSPTGTSNGAITAGVTTAIPVASGGASFTTGMVLWLDTATATEIAVVQSGGSGTSIPCAYGTGTGGIAAGFAKSHLTAMAFGQLLISPTVLTADRVPNAPGWGF